MLQPTKFSKSIQAALLVMMLIASLLTGSISNAQAQAAAPELFIDAGSAGNSSTADMAANSISIARSRLVRVNTSALFTQAGDAIDAAMLPEISLNLFEDANFTGLVTKVQKTADSTTWIGTLKDVEMSNFYLLVNGDTFIAHVASTSGIYEVSTAPGTDGLYKVVQIDQSKLIDDYPGKVSAPDPIVSNADSVSSADSAATIDILVVYTADARIAEGGTAAMNTRIALAVTLTNQAYLKSGVTPRLRLVHAEEIAYTESGDLGTDVSRLTGTSDGYMDNVHSLRNTYAADMVGLIVENGGDYCGMANRIMATAATAFQVTARNCMTGNYSFGHEFGHLQGARHDRYVDTSSTPYAYGHGYVHPGSTTATRWRTIMAYNNYCSDVKGYNCTRLQYFSNPAKTYLGAPMGTTTYNKVYQVLNNTAATVANFRASNFSNTFNTNSSGWSPAYGTWGLTGGAYYYTYGNSGYYASSKQSGTYGNLSYTVRLKRGGSVTSNANYIFFRGNPSTLTSNKDWRSSYSFGFANTGVFSVWKVDSVGTATPLQNWTSSAAIVKKGWNTLRVVAVGSSIKCYINGTLVWAGTDTSYTSGKVGVGMYRSASSSSNILYVDSASLVTTQVADIAPDAVVSQGVELSGGSRNKAP